MQNRKYDYTDLNGVNQRGTVLQESCLLCTTDGHSKFWTGTLIQSDTESCFYVALHWGRIGTVGNKPEMKKYASSFRARQYYTGRVQDKMRKGYTAATPELLAASGMEKPEPKIKAVSIKHTTDFEWDL